VPLAARNQLTRISIPEDDSDDDGALFGAARRYRIDCEKVLKAVVQEVAAKQKEEREESSA
jgi:hypothetical protein